MLGTQIFHNSSMLSCLGILSNPLEIWENPVEALLSTQRLRKQIWEGSRVCFIDLCSRFFEQCVCGSGDQSWADLFMKRLSLEEGRDIYQNYKCRIGFLRSMYIGGGGDFRAFMGLSEPHTTWEPPVPVFELSAPPGRDGGRLKSVHF